jgi:hypothetical protein
MGYDFYFKINDGETWKDEFRVSRHNQFLFELIGGENTFTYNELYSLLENSVKELYDAKENRFDISETIYGEKVWRESFG